MDERTLQAAQDAEEKYRQQACLNRSGMKTYQVIVLGRNGNEPFTIQAAGSEDRTHKMAEAGIDLRRDKWAAGYLDNQRNPQVAYNNDEAKRLVEKHLRRR